MSLIMQVSTTHGGVRQIKVLRSEVWPNTVNPGLWLTFHTESGHSAALLNSSQHKELIAALVRELPEAEQRQLAAHLAQQFPDRRKAERRAHVL